MAIKTTIMVKKSSMVQGLGTVAAITLFCNLAFGANVHIRDGGSGDGSAWDNALDQLPSSLSRGNTYFLAGGTYTDNWTLDDAVSGTDLITIKKATVAAHGSSTGWDDSYATTNALIDANISITTDYWTIDGVTGGGPASWKSGYGFKIIRKGATDGTPLSVQDDAENITIAHVEMEGHGDGDEDTQDGINSGDGVGPRDFSYLYIHDVGRVPMFNRAHNTTWRYFYTGKFESTAQHAEVASFWIDVAPGAVAVTNTLFEFGIITWSEGTGGLIGEWDYLTVNGVIFAKQTGSEFSSAGNGLIGTWTDSYFQNVKVFNCTFINCDTSALVIAEPKEGGSGNSVSNCMFIATDLSFANIGDWNNNEYVNLSSGPTGGAHSNDSTNTVNIYANFDSDDFDVTAESAGTRVELPSGYNTDMFGRTMTTTIGAVQFSEGEDPPAASGGGLTLNGRLTATGRLTFQ